MSLAHRARIKGLPFYDWKVIGVCTCSAAAIEYARWAWKNEPVFRKIMKRNGFVMVEVQSDGPCWTEFYRVTVNFNPTFHCEETIPEDNDIPF